MVKVRKAKFEDYSSIKSIVDDSGTLDRHTTYTYWVALSQFSSSFLVAEIDETIVGFVFCVVSFGSERTKFVWQIGVDTNFRSRGIANQMLDALITSSKEEGFDALTYTITQDNTASNNLFRKIANENGYQITKAGETGTMSDNMKNEIIFQIKLS